MPIFDQGYQHWSGELTGHGLRWLAITRHGVRIGMKNRLLRIALLIAWLPAAVLTFSLCVWGLLEQKSDLVQPLVPFLTGMLGPDVVNNPKAYRVEVWTLCYDYFLLTELRFSMIVVLLVGPGLISRDLRFNALPLYFSRPLRRIDYFVGKLGVVVVFLGSVLVVPSVIAYVLGLLFSLDWTIIRDTFPLLLACVGYGAVMSVSAGLLILALSSLSRNSRYVGLFWLAVWFVSSIVGTVLTGVNEEHRMRQTYRRAVEAERAAQAERPPKSPEDRQRQAASRQEAQRRMWADLQREQREAARSDWRPLFSYTANLSRVGRHWLGADASWEKLAETVPADERDRYLLENMGAQYPWYWSAAVLAVLFGLSICILNFRVRSLDRLK
ncbi:MAG TPA: ABC transporter permease subunit [Gemmataceae bacterium]|nr:ABC transporter permease subunit [Gemmataceae bacterium]